MIASIFKIDRFSGINNSVYESQIEDNESPSMLNIDIDNEGALNKRYGYSRIFPNSLGEGEITGIHRYRKKDNTEIFLFSWGTNLYKYENGTAISIYSTLANAKTKMFTLNDTTYILDGTNYLQYDGTTVKTVEPYVPTLTRNGVAYEDFNLLGKQFKDVFSPDGTQKDFYLSVVGIDSTLVKASLDGGATFTMTEGTGFTVSRTDGKCTFTTAPTKGLGTLVLLAEKTVATKPTMIKKCTMSLMYGGSNDTRVILSGNSEYPNRIFRSGLYNATYFPENGYSDLGSNNEPIMALTKQYDSAIILKQNSVWQYNFELNNGSPYYYSKPLNDEFGCIARDSVQIIDNNPTWLSKKGVVALVNSNVRDERNVKIISEKVNAKLLQEELKSGVSCDYKGKYMLSFNGNTYIFDYLKGIWLYWDNIKASCFFEYENILYLGDNTKGLIHRFLNEKDILRYNDDGLPINCYWKSKLLDFNLPHMLKTVRKLFYNLKPSTTTTMKMYFTDERNSETLILDRIIDVFAFEPFSFEPFGFINNTLPISERVKLKSKKMVYLQVKVENNNIEDSLGLLGISIEVKPRKYVKRGRN